MTIGVLTAYRRLGVGRKLLERMLAHVTEGKGELGDVTEVIKRLSSNDECARVRQEGAEPRLATLQCHPFIRTEMFSILTQDRDMTSGRI